MTRLDWEKASRQEKAKRQRKKDKKKRKLKKVHPNSTAAKKWGRATWED